MVLREQQLGDEAAEQVLQAARAASRSRALAAAAQPAEASLVGSLEARRSSLENTLSTRLGQVVSLLAEDGNGITRFALVIEVATLFDWASGVADLVEAVVEHRREHEQFLIVPTRSGQRIEGIGVNFIQTPLPAMDVGSWASRLPSPRATSLADCIERAVSALQWLSGLNDLDQSRRSHPDVSSIEARARDTHQRAVQELEDGMPDELRERALELVGRWRASIEVEPPGSSATPTFAATCTAGLLGTPNDLVDDIGGLRLAAVEWEIDPAVVRRHFGW